MDEQTDGRTEQGNNNIPELSLESAGIIIVYACIHTEETFYTQQLHYWFNGLLTFYII
jgi:hypothetical protein